MEKHNLYVDVILPLSLELTYSYSVPEELKDTIKIGQIAVVQFGTKKIYTAIIKKIHNNPPLTNVKPILQILDLNPVINYKQLIFWEWLSKYYMCNLGEVMLAALPPAFKLESETIVALNPQFDGDFTDFSLLENKIVDVLINNPTILISKLIEITEISKIFPILKTLVEKGVVITEEEISETYKPRMVKYVCLDDEFKKEENLKKIFDELEKKAFKQLQLLQHFLKLSNYFENFNNEVSKKDLLNNNFNEETLKSLLKKGVLKVYEKAESRLETIEATAKPEEIILSELQQKAFNEIKHSFENKNVVLLHGVTSSGKTEIYIRLIDEVIKSGKQVLFLLPEIALTAQIINRLCKYFGKRVGVYHSKYSEFQRVEVWNRVNTTENDSEKERYDIILGARSAIFLPFSNLGLIIVDEEHDSSYKQYDPSPRYNARDSAIYLAGIHNCKVILGSATPAIETYFNSISGKFGLVEITERYGGMELPEIIIADLNKEKKNKTMLSHFSSILLKSIEEALSLKQQVILFQNRRGFSLRLECDDCHYIPQCKNCDVSLIYHKFLNQLKCHYCGYSIKIPQKCPS
jgi:primosomal protein N' (replication factor Y)